MEPDPYWIENDVPLALYVEDCFESYFACRKQAMDVQPLLGTQRLLEPVSRITLNDWGGLPREISVKYWAFMKLVSGTL